MEWDFTKKIEDMSKEDMKKRLLDGYEWKMPALVIIPYMGLKGEEISYINEELSARCPATGYPDTYKLTIKFIPGEFIPELKSLRFYFMEFYTLPISHEYLCSKIFREFDMQVKPEKLIVELDVAVRGGIKTLVRLEK